ncbi:MAG: hypothetical protein KY445_13690, partial [Armatimonadetes bacterium]|nr:hypothetical protein [Armatimonadota bacterium]
AFGQKNAPKIWLHAVSVGETMAARPIARALKEEIQGVQIALSSTTDTGHDIAKALLQNGEVDAIFYFPLDLTPIQSRVLSALRPDAIGFVETELWPNLLHLARKRGIPTFLVNGRVSDNLFKTAPRLGPLWKWMSGNISLFLMRGEADAQRLKKLGVPDSKIEVSGDVKLESPPLASETLRQQWRHELGVDESDEVLVCGSTHTGEEEIFLGIARQKPNLRLALAPRHPHRFAEVATLIEAEGFKVITRSSRENWPRDAVFLLDSVGELGDFYAIADWAFVGGSLIKRGGHNLLEPVLRGVPVGFGPFVHNFVAQSELLVAHDLGTMAQDPHIFFDEIVTWLDAPRTSRPEFASRVAAALAPHQGAARRMAQHIKEEIHRKDVTT